MENIKIGDVVYPLDNSWSRELLTGNERNNLAGNFVGDKAKAVKILSNPYKLIIKRYFTTYIEEFRNIEYNGKIYRYYNNFTKDITQTMGYNG